MFLNTFKTGLLFFALTGLVLFAGWAIGGSSGIVIGLIVAAVMNLVGYFFSDKIALATMGARQVGPEHPLHQLVYALAIRANLPMPRVYVSPHDAPNAFAAGRSPKHAAVCATEGLLQLLNQDEVAAVMAHELAHVKHRDILIQTVAATIAGAISYLGYFFYFGGHSDDEGDGGGNLLAVILTLVLAPIAAALIQMAISRQREYAADTGGADVCGEPDALASALHKIHAYANRIPLEVNPAFNSLFIAEPKSFARGMSNLFSTHPSLENRLENLAAHPLARRRAA